MLLNYLWAVLSYYVNYVLSGAAYFDDCLVPVYKSCRRLYGKKLWLVLNFITTLSLIRIWVLLECANYLVYDGLNCYNWSFLKNSRVLNNHFRIVRTMSEPQWYVTNKCERWFIPHLFLCPISQRKRTVEPDHLERFLINLNCCRFRQNLRICVWQSQV